MTREDSGIEVDIFLHRLNHQNNVKSVEDLGDKMLS